MHAVGNIPHFGGGLNARRAAGRGRRDYKLVYGVGAAIDCTGYRPACCGVWRNVQSRAWVVVIRIRPNASACGQRAPPAYENNQH